VENQGDAWTVTSAYLDRFLDEQRVLTAEAPATSTELASYLHRMRQIGRRTAELQNALASRADIPEFSPEPIAPEDATVWSELAAQRRGGECAGLTPPRARARRIHAGPDRFDS